MSRVWAAARTPRVPKLHRDPARFAAARSRGAARPAQALAHALQQAIPMLARRSIALSLALFVSACDAGSDLAELGDETGATDETGDEATQGLRATTLRWVLDWEPLDELELVNDLGYRIRVDAGWIGSWGATLIECSADASGPEIEPGSPADERDVASPWAVAEGHSTTPDDPSAWVFAGVESLRERASVAADPLDVGGGVYCQAHYLLAPISDANVGFAAAEAELAALDPDASLVGASLVIRGTWEPPGGGEATPFVLRSEQAYGKILELERDAALDGSIEVELRRDLSSMFDGVELGAELDPDGPNDAAAWQVLGNLAKHTRAVGR